MTTPRARADVELLEKLVLGRLPVVEAERLAVEYADDSRVSELAEAVAGRDDTLIDSLRNHQTIDDPNADELVRRLVQRLRGIAAPTGSEDRTSAPMPDGFTGQPPMPERLEYFQIQKILGEGGMGTVYLADDTRLQRQVALKTLRRELALSPAARERFLHEARSAARLEHDHIVPIYYVGEADGIPFLAMPLLQGEPLDARIQRGSPLPVPEAIRIARQIAAGLAAAHSRGLIHRDIKPGNVWLEAPTGRVKILDFGLVRSQNVQTNLTASGAILGTPAYMAPEQARGSSVDHRADLFSLGCVLYEMLTGLRPFTGPDAMAVLLSVRLDTPKAPHEIDPNCPADLSWLTMRLLDKEADGRPASAGEVVEALARIEAKADATEVMALPPAAKTLPRKRRLLPLVAAALLLALAGVGVLFGGTIYRVATNKGELVIEVDEKAVEVKIVQNGVVVQDKTAKREFTLTAGEGEIEVFERDGVSLATKKFELTRNGKTTVKVTLKELADARKPKPKPGIAVRPALGGDPDRKAAEWMLSIGGTVQVNEQDREIKAVADLPRDTFRLTSVALGSNQKVSDAGLARFKDCKSLTSLHLAGTKVGDAGLAHFKGCKELTYLALYGTNVGDAGLAHFRGSKNVTHLYLSRMQVSDTGLASFKDCKNLMSLDLGSTQVSDAGLAHFAGCKKLTHLHLMVTKVTDAGMANFKDCKNLTTLNLYQTQVGDAGMAHFKDCKNLTNLYIPETQVTDAGLVHFKDCKKLEALTLGNTLISDAGLAYFEGSKKLTVLGLYYMQNVTDAGLAHFTDCKNLGQLNLHGTPIGDAGLAHFKDCENLTHLDIYSDKVTNAGLAYFKHCKNLHQLGLFATRVTDAGLAHLSNHQNLTSLVLDNTSVSDAGLEFLANLPRLKELRVKDTRISKRGYDLMKASMPKCNIQWSETNRTAAEQVLALGGTVTIGTPGRNDARPIKAAVDLPSSFFQVRRVSLAGIKNPLGGLISTLYWLQFAEFDQLEFIDLSGTTTPYLPYLLTVDGLRELSLAGVGLTDESLAQFPKLPTLRRLVLDDNPIKGRGLGRLQELPELRELSLGGPALTDLFAKNLAGLKKLENLSLVGATLTDAGVRPLAALTDLKALDLRKTKVTAAGVEELKKTLPKCKIEWDGVPIPKGK